MKIWIITFATFLSLSDLSAQAAGHTGVFRFEPDNRGLDLIFDYRFGTANVDKSEIKISGNSLKFPLSTTSRSLLVAKLPARELGVLLGILLLDDVFEFYVFERKEDASVLEISSSDEWFFRVKSKSAFGKDELISAMVYNNIDAIAASGFDDVMLSNLKSISEMGKIDQSRFPAILKSFKIAALIKTLEIAKNNRIPVADSLGKFASDPEIQSNQNFAKIRAEILRIEKNDAFTTLFSEYTDGRTSEKTRRANFSEIYEIIASTDSADFIANNAAMIISVNNSELTKAVLRKIVEQPQPRLIPICLILAKSKDPMIAYHAMRTLEALHFPNAPVVPGIERYKTNLGQYRETWKQFLNNVESVNPNSKSE